MKLYIADRAPGPLVSKRLFAAKNIDVDLHMVDMNNKENRSPEFLKLNPTGQIPFLELDDGQIIAEVTAIAEYLEELKPDPVLVGTTAAERAATRMLMRRVDLKVIWSMGMGFQHGNGAGFFADRIPIHEEISAPAQAIASEGMAWLDQQLEGHSFICGDAIRYVDIVFYGFVSFFAKVSQPIDPELLHLSGYMQRMSEHPFITDVT